MTEQDESGGWDTYTPPEGADGLHLRWERDDVGRWVITDLYLHGPALTSGMLRAISLPRLEAAYNSQAAATSPWKRDRIWPATDEGLTTAELRRRAAQWRQEQEPQAGFVAAVAELLFASAPPDRVIPASAPRQRITRPDKSDPEQLEQFYRRVAMAYRQYAQERPPAPAIAEEAGVPVTTVHRWVREARRRGFLPPGRKGQVG